jgi:two-component system KDP operon response regulator KdpE
MKEHSLILVVEDEPNLSKYLRRSLLAEGFDVIVAFDGIKAMELIHENQPDLIILDLIMPHMTGMEVLEEARKQYNMPIIVLTAVGSFDEKIRALQLGADDYIQKPFDVRELQARIEAVMRRYRIADQPEAIAKKDTSYKNGELRIDYMRRQVLVNEQPVHLTPTEYRLLAIMAENTNRVLKHDYLLASVWGTEYSDDVHVLRATIWRLRQKIEHDAANPDYIVNEPGVGYRMQPHDAEAPSK